MLHTVYADDSHIKSVKYPVTGVYYCTTLSCQERYVRLRESVAIIVAGLNATAAGIELDNEQKERSAFAMWYTQQLQVTDREANYLVALANHTLGTLSKHKSMPDVPESFAGLELGPPSCLQKK